MPSSTPRLTTAAIITLILVGNFRHIDVSKIPWALTVPRRLPWRRFLRSKLPPHVRYLIIGLSSKTAYGPDSLYELQEAIKEVCNTRDDPQIWVIPPLPIKQTSFDDLKIKEANLIHNIHKWNYRNVQVLGVCQILDQMEENAYFDNILTPLARALLQVRLNIMRCPVSFLSSPQPTLAPFVRNTTLLSDPVRRRARYKRQKGAPTITLGDCAARILSKTKGLGLTCHPTCEKPHVHLHPLSLRQLLRITAASSDVPHDHLGSDYQTDDHLEDGIPPEDLDISSDENLDEDLPYQEDDHVLWHAEEYDKRVKQNKK